MTKKRTHVGVVEIEGETTETRVEPTAHEPEGGNGLKWILLSGFAVVLLMFGGLGAWYYNNLPKDPEEPPIIVRQAEAWPSQDVCVRELISVSQKSAAERDATRDFLINREFQIIEALDRQGQSFESEQLMDRFETLACHFQDMSQLTARLEQQLEVRLREANSVVVANVSNDIKDRTQTDGGVGG